jgi:dihydroflavonol-4-reductase
MNILVTGASGFIGSAFVKALIAEKSSYNIYCAVRKTSKMENLENLEVEFVNFDLEDYSTFLPAVKNKDIVVHFAALFNFQSPEEDLLRINVEATKHLAKACIEAKVKHFVYCSTTEALGKVVNGTEESEYSPDEIYGKSKMKAEQILLEMQEKDHLPLTIVRPSGVYGPGDYYILTEFIESMDKSILNKIIPTSGNHTIHFTYIDDIVQGFVKIIQQPEKSINQIFILACDSPQTFRYLMDVMLEKLGRKPSIYISFIPVFLVKLVWPFIRRYYNWKGLGYPFVPNGIYKVNTSRNYLNTKAKKELGFNPSVDYEIGIEKTVAWMREVGILEK